MSIAAVAAVASGIWLVCTPRGVGDAGGFGIRGVARGGVLLAALGELYRLAVLHRVLPTNSIYAIVSYAIVGVWGVSVVCYWLYLRRILVRTCWRWLRFLVIVGVLWTGVYAAAYLSYGVGALLGGRQGVEAVAPWCRAIAAFEPAGTAFALVLTVLARLAAGRAGIGGGPDFPSPRISDLLARLFDSEGRITADVPCIGCGYNLHTLLVTAACPECGWRAAASFRSHRLRFAAPAMIRRFCAALLGLGAADHAILLMIALGPHLFRFATLFWLQPLVFGVACIVPVGAVFELTAPQHSGRVSLSRSAAWARAASLWQLMLTLPVSLGFVVWDLGLVPIPARSASLLADVAALFAAAFAIVSGVSLWLYLAVFTRAVGGTQLRRLTLGLALTLGLIGSVSVLGSVPGLLSPAGFSRPSPLSAMLPYLPAFQRSCEILVLVVLYVAIRAERRIAAHWSQAETPVGTTSNPLPA